MGHYRGMPGMNGMGPMVTRIDAHFLLTLWRTSPWPIAVMFAAALAAFWYINAVLDLSEQDLAWPVGRTVAWMAGLVVLVLAWESSLGVLGTISFPVQAVELFLLNLVVPALLALGAPVTLAWYSSGRPMRRRLLGLRHRRWWAVLTHPATAWVSCCGGMFVLFATPALQWVLQHQPAIDVVGTALMLAGLLVWWPVIGLDPAPGWPRSPTLRLATVLAVVATYAVMGLVLVLATSPVDQIFSVDDPHGSGIVALIAAQLVVVGAVVTVAVRWYWSADAGDGGGGED